MTPPSDQDQATVRSWLLARGLPMVLGPRERARHLLRRCSPLIAALFTAELLILVLSTMMGDSDEELDRRLETSWFLTVLAVWAILMIVLPIVVGYLVSRWVKGPRGGLISAVAVTGFLLLGPVISVIIGTLTGINDFPWIDIGGHLVVVALIAGLTYAGFGSVIKWAAGFAWREFGALGKLAGRALPLLMLTVVVFFTGELWQWSAKVDREIVWRTIAFLALAAVAFMLTSLRDEVQTLRSRMVNQDEMRRMLAKTPFSGLPSGARARLTVPERFNVLGVLLVSQAIQVVLFTVLVFVFFVLLGAAMLPAGVIETWAGQPVTTGKWFGIPLPVSNELIQMSQFVAVLSGLYFTVNSSTDPQYRSLFFDPLVAQVGESLAVREIYHHHWR